MAFIVLIIAFVVEGVLAAYRIITRSDQQRLVSALRIGALIVFAIFMLISGSWGLRWYGLAGLLLLWAALGAWTLFTRQGEQGNQFMVWRVVLRPFAMLLLVWAALLPTLVFPEHEAIAPTGEHEVATAVYTFSDQSRVETYSDSGEKRKVNVEFWYPADDAPAAFHAYPLVVFSHGSFGVRTSNETLYNELASHGYVVCSIDHPYQAFFTTDVDGNTTLIDMGYMREVQEEDAHTRKQESHAFYQKWMELRTGDINLVLDTILAEIEKVKADKVFRLVDSSRIGVMGHSLGGSAALEIGRMRNDIRAVAALEAPFMGNIEGVEDGQFVFTDEVYPLPVLNVYSDASWGHLSEWAQYAENYRLLSNTRAMAFNVHISGVGHLTLTDLALTSPFLTSVLDGKVTAEAAERSLITINKVCLAFFDVYLKGKGVFTGAGSY